MPLEVPKANPFAKDKPAADPAAPARLVCPFLGTVGIPQISAGRVERAGQPQVRLVPQNLFCQEEGCMFWHVEKKACVIRAAAERIMTMPKAAGEA